MHKRKAAEDLLPQYMEKEGSSSSESPVPEPKKNLEKKRKVKKSRLSISQPTLNILNEMDRINALMNESLPRPLTSASQTMTLTTPSQPARSMPLSAPKPSQSVTQPKPTKKDKGKQKALPEPEEPDPDDMDSSPEDESSVEFVILEMDNQKTYGAKSHELDTTWEKRPNLYFKDHMAPFQGLMSELRDQPPIIKTQAIAELFRENVLKKFLVATSGMQNIEIKK